MNSYETNNTSKSKYYAFKGTQDHFDEDGYPVHTEKKKNTLAMCTGDRRVILVDDAGRFINPAGLYPQKVRLERWISVSKKVFADYINFLKTKKQLYLTSAEREAV